jgi:hypothetical protein
MSDRDLEASIAGHFSMRKSVQISLQINTQGLFRGKCRLYGENLALWGTFEVDTYLQTL